MENFRPPQQSGDTSSHKSSLVPPLVESASDPLRTHSNSRSGGRSEVRVALQDLPEDSLQNSPATQTTASTPRNLPAFNPSARRIGAPQSSRNASHAHRFWHLNLMPDALERLREHPDFDVHGERAEQDETGHVILAHSIEESDREALYHLELLRMFRHRMQFLATLAMLLLPLFALAYMRLLPATRSEVLITIFFTFGISLSMRLLSHRVVALWQARFVALLGYGLYAVTAGVVVALIDQNQFDNQYAIYYTHNYIMLSVLLLPFTLVETFIVGVILMASLAWSAWWAAPPGMGYFYSSHLLVLGMTTLLVLCIAHFQSMLRRNAFDAAFDLACSAAQLSALSTTDVVTGGFNRLQLEQTLDFELARAARFERPLSLIMFDLDNFKAVNDLGGHAAGDEVLREVWHGAMQAIREIDTVARYGGDEFLIVLPETAAEAAYAIAERLQEEVQGRLGRLFGPSTPEGNVTLSIGVVTYQDSQPVRSSDLIAQADARLYEAKRNGKNRIV